MQPCLFSQLIYPVGSPPTRRSPSGRAPSPSLPTEPHSELLTREADVGLLADFGQHVAQLVIVAQRAEANDQTVEHVNENLDPLAELAGQCLVDVHDELVLDGAQGIMQASRHGEAPISELRVQVMEPRLLQDHSGRCAKLDCERPQ
eukprot:7672168-Pyramimonas_sp.AAC.1